MCSACSGDYEGDPEDSAEPTFDSDEGNCAAAIRGRLPTNATPLGTGAGGSLEGTRDLRGDLASASCAGPISESAGEICEILVSATRIVELRVVTANVTGIKVDKLPDTRAAAMPVARQQSTAALAKYYQTCRSDPEDRNHCAQVRRPRWPAMDALGGLKRVLQRARRAFGNQLSRIPE